MASIQKAMYNATNELRRMTIGTDEFNKKAAEVKQLKKIYNDTQQSLKETATPLQKLVGHAKDLLPAFSFGAIAAGAKYAFDQVIASTDTLSTKWAIFMGGMKGATEEFWRTIATGDWSNFLTNMQEAIRVGREYERMLDDIEAKQRALTIAEADAREEIVATEEALRNRLLTDEQRIAAGERRKQIEKELAEKRTKVAKDEYDNEVMLAAQSSRLSKEKVMQLAADFDSEKKIRAERYNALQEELKLLEVAQNRKGAGTGVLYPGMSSVSSNQNPRIAEIKKEMAGFSSDVVEYAGSLALLGNVTDEQMNKVVSAYSNLKSAEVSGRESIKRIITMVNSLLAKKGDGESADGVLGNVEADVTDNASDALDLAYKKQLLVLKEYYADKQHLQEEYNARELALQIAHLEALAALETDENKQLDLKLKIADAQVKYNDALSKAIPEMMANEAEGDKLGNRLLETAKLTEYGSQKQYEASEAMDAYAAKQQRQAETIQMIGGVMTDYITSALNGTADSFESFGQTLVLMSLQILKQMVPIWAAQILGLSLSSPESVATWGVAGMAKYAAITALMYAGIAAAEGAVNKNIQKKREASTPKKAAGGYTNGARIYIAGEAGKEWIAPNRMLMDPVIGPKIAALEGVRTGQLSPAAIDMFASGGYTSAAGSSSIRYPESSIGYPESSIQNQGIDSATARELTKALNRFADKKLVVYTELIKKDLDTLDEIDNKR